MMSEALNCEMMTFEGVQIRPAAPADLQAVFALERATNTAPHWSLLTYQEILEGSEAQARCLFVAERERAIVGFAVAMATSAASREEPVVAELESLAVAEGVRRRGIGCALCLAVLDWCRGRNAQDVILEVRRRSVGAIALYSALGFNGVGVRPGYYSDPPDDALILRRPVDLQNPLL